MDAGSPSFQKGYWNNQIFQKKVNALTIHEYTGKSGCYCWAASVRQGAKKRSMRW